jgi:hypothetical protein
VWSPQVTSGFFSVRSIVISASYVASASEQSDSQYSFFLRCSFGQIPFFLKGKRGFIWCDKPCARTTLNTHVADRHPLFHGKVLNVLPTIFDDVPGSSLYADLPDKGENRIFLPKSISREFLQTSLASFWDDREASNSFLIHGIFASCRFQKRVPQMPHGWMCVNRRRLWSFRVGLVPIPDRSRALPLAYRIRYPKVEYQTHYSSAEAIRSVFVEVIRKVLPLLIRGDGMVDRCHISFGSKHRFSSFSKHRKGLRTGHLMKKLQIYKKDIRYFFFGGNNMSIPYLIDNIFWHLCKKKRAARV